mmetsp:Transcript_53233/g.169032  ORF Transcript_53233/g.169032 Transcript_53233/m.169032 type:complete len:291 (+) Transcript_53233:403-1275(+)
MALWAPGRAASSSLPAQHRPPLASPESSALIRLAALAALHMSAGCALVGAWAQGRGPTAAPTSTSARVAEEAAPAHATLGPSRPAPTPRQDSLADRARRVTEAEGPWPAGAAARSSHARWEMGAVIPSPSAARASFPLMERGGAKMTPPPLQRVGPAPRATRGTGRLAVWKWTVASRSRATRACCALMCRGCVPWTRPDGPPGRRPCSAHLPKPGRGCVEPARSGTLAAEQHAASAHSMALLRSLLRRPQAGEGEAFRKSRYRRTFQSTQHSEEWTLGVCPRVGTGLCGQ